MLRLVTMTLLLAACSDGDGTTGGEEPPLSEGGLEAASEGDAAAVEGDPGAEGAGGESAAGEGAAGQGAGGEGEGEVADPCAPTADGPGDAPPPTAGAAMVFDPPRNRVWMFGGDRQRTKPAGEDPLFTDDTWEFGFCPPAWNKVKFDTFNLPNKRGGHGVAHDEQGERVFVVFGRDRSDGRGAAPVPDRAYEVQEDVWQYDLTDDSWSKVRVAADGGQPVPRHGHSVIWDIAGQRLVMFGGVKTGVHVGGCTDLPCGALLADTWFLEFGAGLPRWTQLSTENTPPRRQDHAAVLDGATGKMIVTGGAFGKGRYHGDLWVLDLSTGDWTEADPQGATETPSRSLGSFAYHPAERAMLLFGGLGVDGVHNDTYFVDLARLIWVRLGDDDPRENSGRPAPRSEAAIVHLTGDRFAVFGGEAEVNLLNDLWEFDTTARTWKNLSP